jgi:hypothetical protein
MNSVNIFHICILSGGPDAGSRNGLLGLDPLPRWPGAQAPLLPQWGRHAHAGQSSNCSTTAKHVEDGGGAK